MKDCEEVLLFFDIVLCVVDFFVFDLIFDIRNVFILSFCKRFCNYFMFEVSVGIVINYIFFLYVFFIWCDIEFCIFYVNSCVCLVFVLYE